MNKFLRVITTAVVGVGLILLFLYLCVLNNVDKADIFSQPSYYVVQNYWYVFLAGCGCIVFSLVSCFLSWNKSMDTKIEILPNAVAAQKDEVVSWLSGSSLDTQNQKKVQSKSLPEQQTTEKTLHSHSHAESDDTHSNLSEQTIGDATVIQNESNATILDGAEITILDRDLTSATTNEETILENNTEGR